MGESVSVVFHLSKEASLSRNWNTEGRLPGGRRINLSLDLTSEVLVRESAGPPGTERGNLLRKIREFHLSQHLSYKGGTVSLESNNK